MTKSTKEGERQLKLIGATYCNAASSCMLLSDSSGPQTTQYVGVNASYLFTRNVTFSKGAASMFHGVRTCKKSDPRVEGW